MTEIYLVITRDSKKAYPSFEAIVYGDDWQVDMWKDDFWGISDNYGYSIGTIERIEMVA